MVSIATKIASSINRYLANNNNDKNAGSKNKLWAVMKNMNSTNSGLSLVENN